MHTFFWSLLLAAISAITFVAYKHPLSFRKKIAPTLLGLIGSVAVFVSGSFLGGVGSLSKSLLRQSADTDRGTLLFIAKQLEDEVWFYKISLIICGVSFAYVLLLAFLPLVLDLPTQEKRSEVEPGPTGEP